jgi:hypothetical protein
MDDDQVVPVKLPRRRRERVAIERPVRPADLDPRALAGLDLVHDQVVDVGSAGMTTSWNRAFSALTRSTDVFTPVARIR